MNLEGADINGPGSPFGLAWGLYYGLGGHAAPKFMPEVRRLGGGFSKIYLFWGQIEPEPGVFDWRAADAYVRQLRSPDEGLISIFTSSPWATTRTYDASALAAAQDPGPFVLPPTPARNLDDYRRFVAACVSRYRGKVRYWQNDAEANNPLYWSGSADAFVAHLKTFHRAVHAADPQAHVVLGYDGLFEPPTGRPQAPNEGLAFFDHVLARAGGAFDVFDLRLYGDPYSIPGRVAHMRAMMRRHGCERPVICTEYAGPLVFDFARNRREAPEVLDLLLDSIGAYVRGEAFAQAARMASGVAALRARGAALPETLRMFFDDAEEASEARLRRLQSADLVIRNVLALSAGVQRTIYWQLGEVSPDAPAPHDIWWLVYHKIALVTFERQRVVRRYPAAAAFRRMTRALSGVRRVKRLTSASEGLYAFEVMRRGRGRLVVAWARRDPRAPGVQPVVELCLPWRGGVRAWDIHGASRAVRREEGSVRVSVDPDPLFLTRA